MENKKQTERQAKNGNNQQNKPRQGGDRRQTGPSNKQILAEIQHLKDTYKKDPSFQQSLKYKAGTLSRTKGNQLVPYMDEVDRILSYRYKRLDALSIKKFREYLQQMGRSEGLTSKTEILKAYLADDWSGLSSLFSTLAPTVVPKLINYAHSKLKNYPVYRDYIQPGLTALSGYLGEGLNDPTGTFPKTQVFSTVQTIGGSKMYNGVNRKLIQTIFSPVTYNTRPNFHGITKTNLVSGSQLISLTTNSSGNCYIDLSPAGIMGGSNIQNSFGCLYNGIDLSLTTGQQTANPTPITCSLSNSASNISGYRIVSMVVTAVKIPSVLNQGGRIHMCIYDQPLTSLRATLGAPANLFRGLGLPEASLSPFFATSSVAESDGKQMVYNLYADESREAFIQNNGTTSIVLTSQPYGMVFFIQGAQPLAEVIQLQIRYVIEWVSTAVGAPLSNYGYPENGVATPQLIQTLFKNYPTSRFLGLYESTNLSSMLGALNSDTFDQVYSSLEQYLGGVTLLPADSGVMAGMSSGLELAPVAEQDTIVQNETPTNIIIDSE